MGFLYWQEIGPRSTGSAANVVHGNSPWPRLLATIHQAVTMCHPNARRVSLLATASDSELICGGLSANDGAILSLAIPKRTVPYMWTRLL